MSILSLFTTVEVVDVCTKKRINNVNVIALYYLNGTVRPRLSGHVGTSTYPEKLFVRIRELCLNTASSVGFIPVIMYVLIAIVLVTN